MASIFFARRFIGYGYGEYLKDILPYLLLALAAAVISAIVYLLLPGDVWRLCVVPVVYAAVYLGCVCVLKLEMWREMASMLKARMQKGGEE